MSTIGVRSKIGQLSRRAMAPLSICTALALITLGVFAQTFAFKFLNFDDDLFISENPRLTQGLSAKGFAWAFTANLTQDDVNAEYWKPLTW